MSETPGSHPSVHGRTAPATVSPCPRRRSAKTLTTSYSLILALAAAITPSTVAATRGNAQDASPSYSIFYTFGGAAGANPIGGLVADGAGNLYGTTFYGGDFGGSCRVLGCGVVFKVDPLGSETVLHAFSGPDGQSPYGNLIRDEAGNLYGTTVYGGTGSGVVFKVDAEGNETLLYAFTGGADGSNPVAGVIRDAVGNLYGTTTGGGAFGTGVVFKVEAAADNETVLYSFSGGTDGRTPQAGLIQDKAGNFYGTTLFGGIVNDKCGGLGCGVVFKLDPSGTERVLYRFTGGPDGSEPQAGVIRDSAGNLYSTTSGGGTANGDCSLNDGCGVVFKISPSGQETVLHTFEANEGYGPLGLTRDAAGNFYGINGNGGQYSEGTAYELAPTGKLSLLHAFGGPSDAAEPRASLLLFGGALYGVAYSGPAGPLENGVVFKITLH